MKKAVMTKTTKSRNVETNPMRGCDILPSEKISLYNEWNGKRYSNASKKVREISYDGGKLVSAPKKLVKRAVDNLPAFKEEKASMLILVDMSGSSCEVINGTERLTVSLESAAVLAVAAKSVGYSVEVGGVTGLDEVDYILLPVTDKGIIVPAIQPLSSPLAGAIRHATAKMTGSKHAHLVVITDAEPNSSGVGIDPVVDSIIALKEAQDGGIDTLGWVVTDKNGGHESARALFGVGGYLSGCSVSELLNSS
jgi:hypothetical protein